MEKAAPPKTSALTWLWLDGNQRYIEFSHEDNLKINEGVKLCKGEIVLDNRIVKPSENIVLEKGNQEISYKILSLKKKHAFPFLLPKSPNNEKLSDDKHQKEGVFKEFFVSNNRSFFYASLLGVLREAEITKKALDLEEIISMREILLSVNIDFYLKIIDDPEYEKSDTFEQFLVFMQEMEYNLDIKPQKSIKDEKINSNSLVLDSKSQSIMLNLYHKNYMFFSKKKNSSPFVAPFLWMLDFHLKTAFQNSKYQEKVQ